MSEDEIGNKDKDEANDEADSDQESLSQLSQKVKDSARQIWLAGLGAYNKAEGDANKVFDRLVQEGEELENKTRDAVEKQMKAVEETVGGVKQKAHITLNKLEAVFDERVSKSASRLGIPDGKVIASIIERIEALEQAINRKKEED